MSQRDWIGVKIQELDKRSVGQPRWQQRGTGYRLQIPKLWTTHYLSGKPRSSAFYPKTDRKMPARRTSCVKWLAKLYRRGEVGVQTEWSTSGKRNARWGGDKLQPYRHAKRKKTKTLSYKAMGQRSIVHREMRQGAVQLGDQQFSKAHRIWVPFYFISMESTVDEQY